jgi:hypothetical protein
MVKGQDDPGDWRIDAAQHHPGSRGGMVLLSNLFIGWAKSVASFRVTCDFIVAL